nr:thioredoxin family protein [uncultured Desulfobacter sp.]
MVKKAGLAVLVLILLSVSLACAQDFSKVPEKGKVTMVDLGAKKCIPCKMMAPIMEKLEKAYEGKAHIVFIDVWKNREQAPRFGIRAIPTQIFFNENGEEVWRHEGFLEEKIIVERLTKMGVRQPDLGNKG